MDQLKEQTANAQDQGPQTRPSMQPMTQQFLNDFRESLEEQLVKPAVEAKVKELMRRNRLYLEKQKKNRAPE